MKKTLILVSCMLLAQLSQAQNKSTQLDEIAARYASFNKFNGSLLVAEKGKILLQKGYGYRDVAAQLPNDPQTIFQVGSITKEFTAAVILKLAEKKKLSLTDHLSKYEPGFPGGDNIIVQDLLTHTSGIFNYSDMKDIWEKSSEPTDEHAVVDFLKSKTLDFKPGEKFSYSNSNYMLLAYIIQKVTGKTYETAVSDMIFKPLHMTRSGFYFTALKDENKAKGYWAFSAAEYEEGPPTNPTQFIGSGEMYSTVQDLYLWHQALQEGKVLSKALQQQAYRPFKKEYGYGWETADSINGRQVIGHAGRMLNGFESKMLRVPKDDVFIVLLNNNAAGPFLATISTDMLAVLYGKPLTLPEKPRELNPEQMKAYTGKFGDSKERYLEIKIIGNQLFLKDGDNTMQLVPLKNNYFRFMEHEGDQVDFELRMDSNGVAESISLPGRNGTRKTMKKLNE
jgi:CubicO group peptidase (beta-lactamase class C family)